MKQFIAFLIFTSLTASAQHSPPYSLIGYVQSLPDNTDIFLIKPNNQSGKFDTIQTTKSKNGKFSFKSNITDIGELNFIRIDTSKFEFDSKKKNYIALLVDNNIIKIISSISTWPNATILGSSATNDYLKMVQEVNEFNSMVTRENVNLNNIDITSYSHGLANILNKYPNSIATPLITKSMTASMRVQSIEKLYNSWSQEVQNSIHGRIIKSFISLALSSQSIKQGSKIPNFELTSVKGDTIKLHQIIAASGSKLTLIDFWASWCSPCRKEIPKLKMAYDEFKNKGFNIISISIDKNKKSWHDALAAEEMEWFQGIDLDSKVASGIFGFQGIPAHILVDKDLKIIAFDGTSSVIKPFGPSITGDQFFPNISSTLKDQ